MVATITAFERSPDGGNGLARDTRVRWALAEVGQPYDVRLVSFQALKEPAHLALHPFGQIPTYEEGGLIVFETGAIVLRIAEQHEGLHSHPTPERASIPRWRRLSRPTLPNAPSRARRRTVGNANTTFGGRSTPQMILNNVVGLGARLKRHPLGRRPPPYPAPGGLEDVVAEQILGQFDRIATVNITGLVDRNQLESTIGKGVGRGAKK